MENKRGQIWIETVIYTLIGLALIGLVLAIITPQINEFRDRSVIEQTLDSLSLIDSKVTETLSAPGNKRIIDFEMRRGDLYVNPEEDSFVFVMEDSRVLFSEPGIPIEVGRVTVLTEEGSKRHIITLSMSYTHNLLFNGADSGEFKFSSTSIPYRFSIENLGFNDIDKFDIEIKELTGLGQEI